MVAGKWQLNARLGPLHINPTGPCYVRCLKAYLTLVSDFLYKSLALLVEILSSKLQVLPIKLLGSAV